MIRNLQKHKRWKFSMKILIFFKFSSLIRSTLSQRKKSFSRFPVVRENFHYEICAEVTQYDVICFPTSRWRLFGWMLIRFIAFSHRRKVYGSFFFDFSDVALSNFPFFSSAVYATTKIKFMREKIPQSGGRECKVMLRKMLHKWKLLVVWTFFSHFKSLHVFVGAFTHEGEKTWILFLNFSALSLFLADYVIIADTRVNFKHSTHATHHKLRYKLNRRTIIIIIPDHILWFILFFWKNYH